MRRVMEDIEITHRDEGEESEWKETKEEVKDIRFRLDEKEETGICSAV